MVQRLRERLTLLLLVLLPFHALLVTVLTRVIEGPMHAPLRVLTLWKEGLLAVIVGLAIVEIIHMRRRVTWDVVDKLIGALIVFALLVSFGFNQVPLKQFIYGVKYDLVPLIAFLFLRHVPWSDAWRKVLVQVFPLVAAYIAVFGLVALFLPQSFFNAIGYSDMHSLYVPDGPIAAFQQLMGSSWRRMQSVMSGPNQLGMWLVIAWSMLLHTMDRKKVTGYSLLVIGLIGLGIVLTFSRAAWISAFVITLVALWHMRATVWGQWKRQVVGIGCLIGCLAVVVAVAFPQVILRAASSREHFLRPLQAVHRIAENPFGQGLGTAGPASNAVSDACVFFEAGADTSWAKDRPDLCIFAGDAQVQPATPCNCPFLPENWYLQIGVEMGVIGMVVFLLLVIIVILRALPSPAALAMLGIAIGGLFLHAWEDAAVAYTVWLMMAIIGACRTTEVSQPARR